jgi:hypothetical protein
MIKSTLNLIVLILDDTQFEYNILSLNEDKIVLPSLEIIEYLDIDKSVKHILSSYIKDDIAQYVNYKFIDIDITDQLNIYYHCFITFNTKIQNSYKISIKKYENNLPNIQKILKSLT